jgi:signal peptidase I
VIRWVRLPTNDPVFEASVTPSLSGGDLIVLWRLGHPSFADLVLCPEPGHPERYVIGRIAGLPGDQVVLKDGDPMVNDKTFVFERNCDPTYFDVMHPDQPGELVKQQCEVEDMAGHLHKTGAVGGHRVLPEDLTFDVPEGQYFLLSDNRLFPFDSRHYGFVPRESCGEMVVLRLVSRRGWKDSPNRLRYIE